MPIGKITSDAARFKHIIKGHIEKKENLKKYISREELIGKKGNETIRIPVPIITIPRFRYGKNAGGVGQGDGEIGDIIDPNSSRRGTKGSNDQDSGDLMDIEISVQELDDLLMKELGLPYLEPKGNHALHTQKPVYKSIAEHGVNRHFKRTYKEALKRMVSSGEYQPGDAVIPVTRDFRYRAASYQPNLQSSAVLFYLLDVSGSMGDEERRLCRMTNSWLQRIIGRYYDNLEEKFIVHTTNAYEVEGPVFYGTRLAGGTQTSSAFEKTIEIIQKDYSPEEWNIYLFYYSDGENFMEDNDKATALLGNTLLPTINMFCYGECNSGKELFKNVLEKKFNLNNNKGSDMPRKRIRTTSLREDDDILECLRTFLAKDNLPFYQTKV
ncbi:DUF444 family protein [Candidatus Woesearchaeota archaeon]|nr:DUF444 family protein [Candidatus Woesearchaeota archaeon]